MPAADLQQTCGRLVELDMAAEKQMSPGLQLQPIVHVADMAAAIDFYQHLGAEIIHGGRDSDWTLLQLGIVQISLLGQPVDTTRDEPRVELAFSAAMPLDRLEERLRRAGVPVAEDAERLEVRSPDGLLIRITQVPPAYDD
jgi:catechol 2,3-dioxygenase-like lactoylglutathione lyase family enzyme